MLRKIWILACAFGLLLGGCGAPPTSKPSEVVDTATAAPIVNNPETSTSLPTNSKEPAACTVTSPRPTAGPTQPSLYPAPGPEDWVKGPETAYVTILEYSDFQ